MRTLIDLDMSKGELRRHSGISSVSLAKLGKDANLTTAVLVRICRTLNCNIGGYYGCSSGKNTRNTEKIGTCRQGNIKYPAACNMSDETMKNN